MSPADPEVDRFLRHSLVVQVASLSPQGRPFATPLWFVVDREVLYLTTGAQSRAGKNVARNPDVVLLFAGELDRGPTRFLRLRGTAAVHPGLPPWRALLRIAAKYYLPPKALLTEIRNAGRWRLRQHYYAQAKGGPGYIRVVPSAWEFLFPP
ncbi:MAG: pyridoxamine 5'-phosphate oxidase family protein [Deltaproteobacteria bacterium]|nr:pyridoxamine 5'-phosphate oxidase family protein [Deltaproteobacteria bacterium]